MKKLLTLLMIILSCTFTKAQKETAPAVEIFCITEGLPAQPIMTFTMTAQSQCWGKTLGSPPLPQQFFLTDDYDISTFIPAYNNMGQNSAGFDFIALDNGFPIIAFGLYKFTNNLNNKYFYLDYRDYRATNYGLYPPNSPSYLNSIDIWIKYRYDKDSLYYSSSGSANDFHNIVDGQLLNIWDLKQKGTQFTSYFPDYWENSLAGIMQKNPSTGIFEPFIVWGPFNGFQPTGYEIYWRLGSVGNFHFLATVDANTFTYRHNGLAIGSGLIAEYKVRAYNNQSQFGFTNIASVGTSGLYKEKSENLKSKFVSDYKLYQNYPNPFNPATTISYSISENSFATLKVYDILGNVVAVLLNETKEAGNYSVSFDASNLSSGLYFYALKANGYSITKKMLLAK